MRIFPSSVDIIYLIRRRPVILELPWCPLKSFILSYVCVWLSAIIEFRHRGYENMNKKLSQGLAKEKDDVDDRFESSLID